MVFPETAQDNVLELFKLGVSNPDVVAAQMEGGIGFGAALRNKITGTIELTLSDRTTIVFRTKEELMLVSKEPISGCVPLIDHLRHPGLAARSVSELQEHISAGGMQMAKSIGRRETLEGTGIALAQQYRAEGLDMMHIHANSSLSPARNPAA